MKTHYSPFRYPGGKSWLVPFFRYLLLNHKPPKTLVEPFAGGAIISLTAAFENLADQVVMCELDDDVASVWTTILSPAHEELCDKIFSYQLTREQAQATLASKPVTMCERAFQCLLRNRVSHGGKLTYGSGLINRGENDKGISSRWYPVTLTKRIKAINKIADRIEFIHGLAFDVIPSYDHRDTLLFVDPPYTLGKMTPGSRLYTHHSIDHARLFDILAKSQSQFLLTYNDAPDIRQLAMAANFDVNTLPMRTTLHKKQNELIISNGYLK